MIVTRDCPFCLATAKKTGKPSTPILAAATCTEIRTLLRKPESARQYIMLVLQGYPQAVVTLYHKTCFMQHAFSHATSDQVIPGLIKTIVSNVGSSLLKDPTSFQLSVPSFPEVETDPFLNSPLEAMRNSLLNYRFASSTKSSLHADFYSYWRKFLGRWRSYPCLIKPFEEQKYLIQDMRVVNGNAMLVIRKRKVSYDYFFFNPQLEDLNAFGEYAPLLNLF